MIAYIEHPNLIIMVFWHTAYKKHHSWLIRKTRFYNFAFVIALFYGVYWFNRYSMNRTMWYLDRIGPSQVKANKDRRDYGYRAHYEPLVARSKKHYLISQGDYAPRIPYEDQLLP